MISQMIEIRLSNLYYAGPGSPNVHAEWVELQGTVNSFTVSGLNYLKSRIVEVLCDHIAKSPYLKVACGQIGHHCTWTMQNSINCSKETADICKLLMAYSFCCIVTCASNCCCRL